MSEAGKYGVEFDFPHEACTQDIPGDFCRITEPQTLALDEPIAPSPRVSAGGDIFTQSSTP